MILKLKKKIKAVLNILKEFKKKWEEKIRQQMRMMLKNPLIIPKYKILYYCDEMYFSSGFWETMSSSVWLNSNTMEFVYEYISKKGTISTSLSIPISNQNVEEAYAQIIAKSQKHWLN